MSAMLEKYDEHGNREIKVSILGLQGSGKTSIVNRFARGNFNESEYPTQRVNIEKKVTKINGKKIAFSFWDIAGQQGYNSIASLYFGKAHIVLFVYDISNYESFKVAKEWMEKVSVANPCVFTLVGNKLDTDESRAVSHDEAQEYALMMNASFFECSAMENMSIDEIFLDASERVLKKPTRPAGMDIGGNRGPPIPEDDGCAC